jgi:hypothetical protein
MQIKLEVWEKNPMAGRLSQPTFLRSHFIDANYLHHIEDAVINMRDSAGDKYNIPRSNDNFRHEKDFDFVSPLGGIIVSDIYKPL